MYKFKIRPGFGRELAAPQPKQHQVSNINHSSSESAGSFLLSFLPKKRRIRKGTSALLTGCIVSVLAGCGGMSYNSKLTGSGSTTTEAALSTISCGTQSLSGAQSKDCSVYLTAAATEPTKISLTSSNAALGVPTTVIVAAGAKTAAFNAVSEAVSQSLGVTITAQAGIVTKTAVITLYPVAVPTPAPASVATLSKISCGSQTLTGPTTKACSVYLTAAAASRTVVTLSSNNGALQAPAAVTVPTGATSTGFNVSASAVSNTETATLTATANGVSQMDVITLSSAGTPAPAPVATLNKVSCGAQTLTGPVTTACSVYLSAAATSQTVVTLSSSSSMLQAPASVTVPAGATSTGFNLTASAVSATQTATLTATAGGVSQMDAITLNPATPNAPVTVSTLSKISCGSQTLTGPATDACLVSLSAATASQTVVTLSSSSSALTVPASVTVAAGATSASFSATASAVTAAAKVTLTATADNMSQTDVIQLQTSATQPSTQHEVKLEWAAPPATSDPVVGYNVYRLASGVSNYALLSSSVETQTSYSDTTVQSGVTYEYVVRSVDGQGVESAASNSTTVTVP